MKEMLDAVFSLLSVPRLQNEDRESDFDIDERPNIFIRDKPIFSSEKVLHKDYYRKGSVGMRNLCGRGSQGA
jgi:hypothetical protein